MSAALSDAVLRARSPGAFLALSARLASPLLARDLVANPVTGRIDELKLVLFDLMDRRRWGREKIAAWLKECGW